MPLPSLRESPGPASNAIPSICFAGTGCPAVPSSCKESSDHSQSGVPSQSFEVGVVVKDRHIKVKGNGGDETVDQLANWRSFLAAEAKKGAGMLVVQRFRSQDRGTCKQAS